MDNILGYITQARDIALEWLLSPAAWGQAAVIVVAILVSVLVNRYLKKILVPLLSPAEEDDSLIARARRFLSMFMPLLLPVVAYAVLAAGEATAAATFGASEVIGFGKRLFILWGTWILVRDIIKPPLLLMVFKYAALPIAALYTVGLLDESQDWLGSNGVELGNISFTYLSIVRGLIFGAVLFWLGRWSNDHSANYIRAQDQMAGPTRELATKAVELGIFAACFLLLMSIMGINLSALAVLGGAIGLGLGFGLQKIASNFISGIILLLEGQATVGDYVELDGGEAGKIIKMMSRATILETFDGKWILVPNEDFIVTRVVNYSDNESGNRYEAEFSVSYDTDINKVPALVEAAVSKHPDVLQKPEPPDCELRGFGDSGVDFAVEFWVAGIDDGKNKYTSDVLFIIWNTLKDNGIEIPYPQRVVEIKGGMPRDI
ncbi:MAG: mechanosensitive ion channel domain-containing protein [Pseudomonadota bacterium]